MVTEYRLLHHTNKTENYPVSYRDPAMFVTLLKGENISILEGYKSPQAIPSPLRSFKSTQIP